MNLRIGGPGTSHRPWLLCAASAAGLRKETADVIVRLSSIVFLPPRHFGPALTGARVWAIHLTRAGILRHRRRGAILWALRVLRPVVVRNVPGCWRGTPGKANVSLPFAVVVFVCHLYRLVSCITRPSYKKDVQQMRTYAKTSVSGVDGSEPGAIKRHLLRARIAPSKRALATSGAPRRSSQKRCRSFCSSAFGRAASGVAVPRLYLKATK